MNIHFNAIKQNVLIKEAFGAFPKKGARLPSCGQNWEDPFPNPPRENVKRV